MIATDLDGSYRVTCREPDCPRPLDRTVGTSAHAENLSEARARMIGPGVVVATPVLARTYGRGPHMAKRTCSIGGCDKVAHARGWCGQHYSRWLKHGNPETILTGRGQAPDWFAKTLAMSTSECIEWPFGASGRYGRVRWNGVDRQVTQVILELSGIPQPDPQSGFVLHSCDNPPCCNPRHLRWGTVAENSADMIRHGRSMKGERHPNAKLTESDVLEIRSRNYSIPGSHAATAAEFGLHPVYLSRLLAGRWWKHV